MHCFKVVKGDTKISYYFSSSNQELPRLWLYQAIILFTVTEVELGSPELIYIGDCFQTQSLTQFSLKCWSVDLSRVLFQQRVPEWENYLNSLGFEIQTYAS